MTFTDEDRRLDAIFAALAHPIRRALVARLDQGSATVSQLAEPFDVSLMAISKHLSVLEKASVIQRESEGRYTRCSMQPGGLDAASAWIENHSRFWSSQFASFGRYLQETQDDDSGTGDGQ